MLAVHLTAVGRSMPGWVEAGWTTYVRRLPAQISLKLDELAPANSGNAHQDQRREGDALLRRGPRNALRVALDGGGQPWSTLQLAERMERWMGSARPIQLLVGGAEGHGRELLESCDRQWSLGPLTLPHMLVRVIVAEQFYRAWTVLSGHPYHRA